MEEPECGVSEKGSGEKATCPGATNHWAFPGMSPGSTPLADLPGFPTQAAGAAASPPKVNDGASAGSLCQLHDGFQSWGWWLPVSLLRTRLFQDLAASFCAGEGRMEGRQWRGGRGLGLHPPGVSEANFFFSSCFCCPLLVEWVCQVGITFFEMLFIHCFWSKKQKSVISLLKVWTVAQYGNIFCGKIHLQKS